MKNTMKKRLAVWVCLAACVALVVMIGSRLHTEKPVDDPLPAATAESAEITVDIYTQEEEKPVVVAPPDTTASASEDTAGDSEGTEQTIQPDPEKPEYVEEQLTDPNKTPDGKIVVGTPTPENHATYTPPTNPANPNPSGGLPGFGNVPDGGANQGAVMDGAGDINKQVGVMG